MNPKIPIVLGVAGILGGIGTAIGNANGAFAGHPFLHYWFYAGAALLILAAVVLVLTSTEQKSPNIVATQYGEAKLGTGIHSHGYPVGDSGLIVVNDGEPGYEIGVYPPFGALNGTSKLHFKNTITRLTKQDGNAQLSAWIEEAPGRAVLGNGLFEFMREKRIASTTVPILYKDARGRWYKTICTIERDVRAAGGLAVKSEFKGRTRKPNIQS